MIYGSSVPVKEDTAGRVNLEAQSEPERGTKSAGALISDFSVFRTVRNKLLLPSITQPELFCYSSLSGLKQVH